ncbi:hypothetical protein CN470_30550 [Bacillus cereus]|nr:hypothetical protein CN470_30550 [Bacillus cereus]
MFILLIIIGCSCFC